MHARSKTGLMIIELRKYNSAKELLIGLMNARSGRWVINWNMEQRVSVAMEAVHMREMGNRARDKIQACIQLASDSGMRENMDPMVLGPTKGHQ